MYIEAFLSMTFVLAAISLCEHRDMSSSATNALLFTFSLCVFIKHYFQTFQPKIGSNTSESMPFVTPLYFYTSSAPFCLTMRFIVLAGQPPLHDPHQILSPTPRHLLCLFPWSQRSALPRCREYVIVSTLLSCRETLNERDGNQKYKFLSMHLHAK